MPKTKTPLEQTQAVLDVSTTERQTFKKCRRQWELTVLENLEPRVPPTFDLEFGTGIHRALEAYYINKNNQPLLPDTKKTHALPLKGALLAWDEWYTEMDVRLETDTTFPSETIAVLRDELLELADLGEEMLRGYHQFAKVEDQFTVHAVEGLQTAAGKSWLNKHYEEREFHNEVATVNGVRLHESNRFLVPILDPKDQVPIRRKPMLSARIDLIVHRIDPGMKGIWIYDHKTTSSQPNDRGLDFDDQVTAYCYAVWRWLGIVPRGVCFNYLVKQAPKPPRILKGGKLSTAKTQLTRADWYRKELIDRGLMLKDGTVQDIDYAETYEALLSRGWEPFFKRHYVTRNRHELLEFEARLADEYNEMYAGYMGDLPLYPNFSRMWCPGCRVAPICQAIEDGSDVEGIIDSRYQQAPDRKAMEYGL